MTWRTFICIGFCKYRNSIRWLRPFNVFRSEKMTTLLEFLVPAFGIGVLIPTVFIWFLWHIDDQLQPEFKAHFSEFLLSNSPLSSDNNFSRYFVIAYDTLFGKKVFSWKYLIRSFMASFITVTAMFLVWLAVNSSSIACVNTIGPNDIERWEALMGFSAFKNYATIGTTFAMTLVLACLLNLFPDYLSLIQSRVIIGRMVGKSFGKCLMYFVLDLTLTTIIALTVISIWLLIQIDTVSNFHLFLERVIATGFTLNAKEEGGHFSIFGIFIYSTYFTSVWLWLYTIAVLMMRTRGSLRPFQNILLIRRRPFRCIGMVMFLAQLAKRRHGLAIAALRHALGDGWSPSSMRWNHLR